MQFNEIKAVIPIKLPDGTVREAEVEIHIGGEVTIDFDSYDFVQMLSNLLMVGGPVGFEMYYMPAIQAEIQGG